MVVKWPTWKVVSLISDQTLGLPNAYNPMYFDTNISENKDGKSCVTNSEFYLSQMSLGYMSRGLMVKYLTVKYLSHGQNSEVK